MNARYLSWGAAAAVVLVASAGAWQWWTTRPISEPLSQPSSAGVPASTSISPVNEAKPVEISPMDATAAGAVRETDAQLQLLRWQVRLMAAGDLEPGLRTQSSIQTLERLSRWLKLNPVSGSVALQEAIQADLSVLRQASLSHDAASPWLDRLWQWEQRVQAIELSQWLPAESASNNSYATTSNTPASACPQVDKALDFWGQAQSWWQYSWCEMAAGLKALWNDSVRIQTLDANQVLILDPVQRRQWSLARMQEVRITYYSNEPERVKELLESLTREWQTAQPRWWAQVSEADREIWNKWVQNVPAAQSAKPKRTLSVLMELTP